MELSEDALVEIPQARLGFFGGPGKMLLPSPATVAALIAKVPARKLITTDLLCQVLARQFNVRGTCPVTASGRFDARDPIGKVADRRVLKANGGLSPDSPAGLTVRPNA